MTNAQLEHLIRAVGDLLSVTEVMVIGSQAVLGSYPRGLPRSALVSVEADFIPFDDEDATKATLISGAVGELSRFHEQYGVYGDGVELSTGRFPAGWTDRLVAVNTPATNGVTGWCAEPHDVVVAKLLAGREKDVDFAQALLQAGFVRAETLLERLLDTDATPVEVKRVARTIDKLAQPGRNSSTRRLLRRIEGGDDTV